MVRKLPIIREIFKGNHNAAAAARKLRQKQISVLSGMINYCVNACLPTATDRDQRNCKCVSVSRDFRVKQTVKPCLFKQTLNVSSNVVAHACIVKGQQQRKGASPVFVHYQRLKYVSCVDKSSFVQPVTNVQTAVQDLPVGARLHQFWEKWEALKATVSPSGPGQI